MLAVLRRGVIPATHFTTTLTCVVRVFVCLPIELTFQHDRKPNGISASKLDDGHHTPVEYITIFTLWAKWVPHKHIRVKWLKWRILPLGMTHFVVVCAMCCPLLILILCFLHAVLDLYICMWPCVLRCKCVVCVHVYGWMRVSDDGKCCVGSFAATRLVLVHNNA